MNTQAIEQEEVRVGYLALTDCAPIIVAAALGFDRQYGIRIVPSREPSWAAVRDKLLGGALDAGRANFPYLSDGMWFLTQFRRWGLLHSEPDYVALAERVNQTALYCEAASALDVCVPDEPLRSSRLIDGRLWDGLDPLGYARSFDIAFRPAERAQA